MEFKYTVRDSRGNRISAEAKAESVALLVSKLKQEGLLPLQIKEIKKNAKNDGTQKQKGFRRKIKLGELAIFTRQLYSTINAGIILTEALETISNDLENRYFRRVIEALISHIRAGLNFSSALLKFPAVFPSSFIAVIKAGEESGSLSKTLGDLAEYLEEMHKITQKIKSATRYPMFLIGFCIFIVSVIVFFIIPRFKLIYTQVNAELPLFTRIVIRVSEVALKNIHWLITGSALLVILFMAILKITKVRLAFDRLTLRLFILGKIIKKALITRFCRTLSILLSGGVGLITALPISCEVTNNTYLVEIIEKVKNSVLSGSSLTNAMKEKEVFPMLVVKMVQVGEKTGKLSDMLRRNADYYDHELESTISAFTSLVEPVLIVFVGIIVGIVVIAFYLPIFKIASLVTEVF